MYITLFRILVILSKSISENVATTSSKLVMPT